MACITCLPIISSGCAKPEIKNEAKRVKRRSREAQEATTTFPS